MGDIFTFPSSVISLQNLNEVNMPISRHSLHPFPARMAPEIVVKAINSVPRGASVLDTMCGSGTVLRESVMHGHHAIGFDVDPLAVLISKVSTTRLDLDLLMKKADDLANQAESKTAKSIQLPWIDTDEETQKFIRFWFGPKQCVSLRALAWLTYRTRGPIGDALRVAISKIIITKEPCASLARDTSHSRPHRIAFHNTYDVIQGFRKAVVDIRNKLAEDEFIGSAEVSRCDARRLPSWITSKVQLVVTSPPYGNAIDYVRGHRLALVWLGYNLKRIRMINAHNVGRQTGTCWNKCRCTSELMAQLGRTEQFEPVIKQRLALYVQDMYSVIQEIHRSLVGNGHVILVVGNSSINGQFVDNANMTAMACKQIGLQEIGRYSREIPANHRYLPPPRSGGDSSLGKRMKEEVVLTFKKICY
jgi:DNA modification methylase